MDRCILKQSDIHGIGLFSKTPFLKNEKIVNYYGEEMSYTNFLIIYGNYKDNCLNTYRMKRINKILVAKNEPYKSENLINFVNESNEPNCILKRRALYALRNIEINEELTIKYPSDYKRDYELSTASN